MKRQQLDRILLYASIACFFFTSFSILILPPKLSLTHQRLFGAVAGGVFWFSLLAGVALQVALAIRRREWKSKNHAHKRRGRRALPGVIAFGKNPFALAADVACGVCLIAFIAVTAATKGMAYACSVLFAFFVFTFCLHCILNGKIFDYVQNQNKHVSHPKHQ